jgi:hypothetical protein
LVGEGRALVKKMMEDMETDSKLIKKIKYMILFLEL